MPSPHAIFRPVRWHGRAGRHGAIIPPQYHSVSISHHRLRFQDPTVTCRPMDRSAIDRNRGPHRMRSTTRRTLSVLPFACIVAMHAVRAREVRVDTYEALRDACRAALPADTITIAPGTYTIAGASRIMITARPGPVLVRGVGGDPSAVVVRGNGQDDQSVEMIFNLEDSPRWTFQDLTTRDSYYHGFKFDRASTDCVLRDIVMRDHGESGVKGTSDPAAGLYPDRLLIDRCDIGFSSGDGGTRSVVEGVDGVGVNDWIIQHCRFINVQHGGGPATAIFTKGNSSNTIIDGNRFENCFIGASFGG